MEEFITCETNVIHEDIVKDIAGILPDRGHFSIMADFYKIFSEDARLRILWVLCRREMCVCDLAAILGVSISSVSHQLKTLKMSGIVKYKKTGKVVYYSISDQRIRDIMNRQECDFY